MALQKNGNTGDNQNGLREKANQSQSIYVIYNNKNNHGVHRVRRKVLLQDWKGSIHRRSTAKINGESNAEV